MIIPHQTDVCQTYVLAIFEHIWYNILVRTIQLHEKEGDVMKSIGFALIFNGLDLATGFLTAVKQKDIQSSKLRDGLFKKAGFLICYTTAFLVDRGGEMIGFSLNFPILPVVITYAVTTELVSIIENISRLNPDLLPEKLQEMFHVKHEQ